jgi:hypothetical protein
MSLNDTFWIQTYKSDKNYLTKINKGQCLSTEFAYGSVFSTVFVGESARLHFTGRSRLNIYFYLLNSKR